MFGTVVIADDHAVSAIGLADLLQKSGFEIVGVAPNGIEAISLIKKHTPTCAVLDLSMPGANGLEVFLEAGRWSPETRFAVITGNPLPGIFHQLQNAGVHGLFLKSENSEIICDGVEKISKGIRIISKAVQEVLDQSQDPKELSPRELEILQGISRGMSNTKIAEHLGISPKTIDSHRTNLMRKMGVHSTATLLVQAMKLGLIDISDSD